MSQRTKRFSQGTTGEEKKKKKTGRRNNTLRSACREKGRGASAAGMKRDEGDSKEPLRLMCFHQRVSKCGLQECGVVRLVNTPHPRFHSATILALSYVASCRAATRVSFFLKVSFIFQPDRSIDSRPPPPAARWTIDYLLRSAIRLAQEESRHKVRANSRHRY